MSVRPVTIGGPRYDLAIIGTVGLPASYGGFETLAEQLTRRLGSDRRLQVFCTSKRYPTGAPRPAQSDRADLAYVDWDANGWQSVPYDFVSLWRSARQAHALLVLGVSGCLLLPLIRLLWPSTRVVTNVDGLEWKRRKWGRLARMVLRLSEWAAVRFSHAIVSDNQGIREHIARSYGYDSHLIAYGGDHVTAPSSTQPSTDTRFERGSYFLAICRVEPENNIEEVLQGFAAAPDDRIVVVGNWAYSAFSRALRNRFSDTPNIELKDPIYDQSKLHLLRQGAKAYVHGHSAGGTNPSLVEAMFAGMAVLAFDVGYNRHTTENQAIYWQDAVTLAKRLSEFTPQSIQHNASAMARIARERYTWDGVAAQYAAVLFPTT